MYNLKLDGFWHHLRGNKKTGEIFNFSLKSNRNAPLKRVILSYGSLPVNLEG